MNIDDYLLLQKSIFVFIKCVDRIGICDIGLDLKT